VIPFWQRSDVRDAEQGPIYLPAGDYLPPRVRRRSYDGPGWNDFNSVAGLQGLLVTASPWRAWTVRAGLFRSLFDDKSSFAQLYEGLTPDGRANRLIIADPHSRFVSVSGELRVSRALTEGPRLHLVHLSYRGRNRRQRYGGSDYLDFGPLRLGESFRPPEPDYTFTEQTRDLIRQSTVGIAYEGRWRDLGELSFGVSRTSYRKTFELPGEPAIETQSRPWVYNVTAAAFLGRRLTAYAGYSRGLEESGIAPDNAANRNQPLAAVLTRQVDGGLRFALTDKFQIVAGAFELRKPYYNLDSGNRFGLLGEIVNRGIEFSLAGAVTPSLNLVAGGVLLRPQVTGKEVALGRIGERPVGLPSRSFDFNVDWQSSFLEGLSFDLGVSHVGAVPATQNNAVIIPARTLVDLGARYRFKLSERSATLRLQVSNVGGTYGYELLGAGAYDLIPGRVVASYLTVDF
jgi:iron complex outermembrane receptor protein